MYGSNKRIGLSIPEGPTWILPLAIQLRLPVDAAGCQIDLELS